MTTHTTNLINDARAAGLRLSNASGKLRITSAPPPARAMYEPKLQANAPAVLAWLKWEQTARIMASNAARSDAATEKAIKLLKRKRKQDRGEQMIPYHGHILAIDSSGGRPIETLNDREATRLFLHWLRDARDRYYLEIAKINEQRSHFDAKEAVAILLERVKNAP